MTVGSEKGIESVAAQLCDTFERGRQNKQMKTIETFVIEEDIRYDIKKPPWIYTVFWLFHRNLLIVTRDSTIHRLQILQKIVSVCLRRSQFIIQNNHIFGNCLYFPGNSHNGRPLFLWNCKTQSIWHTIGSRGIIYFVSRKLIYTDVFGHYPVPEARSIVYARTSSWPL